MKATKNPIEKLTVGDSGVHLTAQNIEGIGTSKVYGRWKS
jgi:hypothetical protein